MLNNVENDTLSVCSQLVKNLPVYKEKLKNNSESTSFQAALMSIGIYGDYTTIKNVTVRCCDMPEETYVTTMLNTKYVNRVSSIPDSYYDAGIWTLPIELATNTKNILEIGELSIYNTKVVEDDERNRSEYFRDVKLSKVKGNSVTGGVDVSDKTLDQIQIESDRDAKRTRTIEVVERQFVKMDVAEAMEQNSDLGNKVFGFLQEV